MFYFDSYSASFKLLFSSRKISIIYGRDPANDPTLKKIVKMFEQLNPMIKEM